MLYNVLGRIERRTGTCVHCKMSCHVKLSNQMVCNEMLSYMLCYVMLYYVILCCVILCYIMLYYVILCYVVLDYFMLYFLMPGKTRI